MKILVLRSDYRCFHRSWFKWWQITDYVRCVCPDSTDPFELVTDFIDWSDNALQMLFNVRLQMPFEACVMSHKVSCLGEGVSDTVKWGLGVQQGTRFIPLTPWVKDVVQWQIRYFGPLPHQQWYVDFPFSYRADWVNRTMQFNLRTRAIAWGEMVVIGPSLSLATVAQFARHAQGYGYVPIKNYQIMVQPTSHKRRIVEV